MAGASTATDPSTVTDYFAQVLRRQPLEEVAFQRSSVFVATPRERIAEGSLTSEHTQALFDAHDREAERSRSEKDKNKAPDASISVAISLASVPEQRGSTQQGILLLAATLKRDGTLEPDLETGTSPWVPAERLIAPAVTEREVMVGDLRNFWVFTRTELAAEASRCESVADAMKLAGRLFTSVAGRSLDDFATEHTEAGRIVERELCYVQEHDRINAVGALLDVYEALDREPELPPILEQMITGWDGQRIPEERIHVGDGLLWNARLACGSMNDENPLTASQRRAVHAFLQGGEGEVTAVSGPPGTGKTTMLQAIVAGMITRRALEREDAPVIVGTSTNNQAVTNIIASFASVTKKDPGILDLRWLPQERDGGASEEPLRSLAVYCPAKAKLSAAKKQYLVEQKDRSELYADYSSPGYLADARDHFLAQVHYFFGSIEDPARVQDWLHDALTEVDGYRLALLGAMNADGRSEDYLQLCAEVEECTHLRELGALSDLRDCTSLEELDKALDTTLRYAEFWLAVHYYEAEWLLAKHLGRTKRFKSTVDVLPLVWPQAAALTPCFVITLYQVPKYFGRYTMPGEPKAFDVGRIDLLIVDEAGQVDTPLALPVIALAQRALVVGDEKQLAPVWALDEETDREIAEGAGIEAGEWANDLRERGVTASAPSSLMRAASHASRWSFGDDEPGLLLREHFRCHADIIGFSNELLYDGLLEPMRAAKNSLLHGIRPAFEWIDVQDSEDSRRGSSRVNEPEAKAIAAWIVENFASFYDLYHHQQKEPDKKVDAAALIGVVTPFRAQADVITEEIRKAARAAHPDADLPTNLATKITVGTAHRLQGAERPIILFSAVYGNNSAQAGFIDKNPELMNVAVSRAKDLLVVFAAPHRWDNGKIFGVMSRYAERAQVESSTAEDPVLHEVPPAADEQRADTSRIDQPDTDQIGSIESTTPTPDVLQTDATTQGENTPEAAATAAAPAIQGTLTTVIRAWSEAGILREGDAGLKAGDLNLRLAAAGILDGEPGAWEPTRLAALLGVVEIERMKEDGSTYASLEYTPQMQGVMLQLYRGSHL
ncbi:DEAD/DEAH box helicase [Brachybacterium tyrofermentans]|uniref:DEAD/DEAH box helicase n=1 Tax=Brachybacterium tyrofermentans TaxID=47848 RepID=UPI003FD2B9B3